MLRNIILGVGVFAALFSILIFSGRVPFGGGDKANVPKGDVNVWGTLPSAVMAPIIQVFNPQAKTYKVVYREVPEEMFASYLLEALANGTGPDVIMGPHELILSQSARIYPFPLSSMPEATFRQSYVDGAQVFLTPSGAIALPVAIDPMVLFYNRRIFSKEGVVNPPVYWDEVTSLVPKLTKIDDSGAFIQSGIGLGAATTPYSKDILMAIVGQLGQVPLLRQYAADTSTYVTVTANTPVQKDGNVKPLSDALRYFTQFADTAKTTYTWNDFAGRADDQFVAEKLAMYLGYAGEYDVLRARNPKGDYGMATFPQTRDYNTFVTGGKLYGIATLKNTRNLLASLTVQSQFGGPAVAQALATGFGGVPALRAYATTPGIDPVIAKSMLVTSPWYDIYKDRSSQLVMTMIADVVNGRAGPTDAASAFVARLQDLYTTK